MLSWGARMKKDKALNEQILLSRIISYRIARTLLTVLIKSTLCCKILKTSKLLENKIFKKLPLI